MRLRLLFCPRTQATNFFIHLLYCYKSIPPPIGSTKRRNHPPRLQYAAPCLSRPIRQRRTKPTTLTDFSNHFLYCLKSIPSPKGEHKVSAQSATTAVRRSLPATDNQATAGCRLTGILHSNSLASLVPLLHFRILSPLPGLRQLRNCRLAL